jgi:hypothetical protein
MSPRRASQEPHTNAEVDMKVCTRRVAVSGLALVGCAGLAQAQNFAEAFNDIATLTTWNMQNKSDQAAAGTGWFQGNGSGVFPAHSGGVDAYIGSNYQATTGVAPTGVTISTWLLTPTTVLHNGDQMLFFTRSVDRNANGLMTYPDRMQIRLSTSGASTTVGNTSAQVGDFTTLLLDINPTYSQQPTYPAGYPDQWTGITVTLSGLAGTPSGRLAFRYYVQNAGIQGIYSNYIGVDDVVYTTIGTPTGACCNADGTCTGGISSTACTVLGGQYRGDGSACGAVACEQPGACCRPNGLCAFTAQFACTALGGTFNGAGVACAAVTCPGEFKETADAGDLPASATTTTGTGSLLAITGTLSAVSDVDMFKISVCNAGSFRATTVGTGTGIDTELWLFDAAGVGVVANDDDFDFGPASTLTNAFVQNNGTYYLALSEFDYRPSSAGGMIWNAPANSTLEFSPDGAGATQPVTSWANWTGTPTDTGAYSILLQGSCFAGPPAQTCYANCDSSTANPFLNVADFTCFLTKYSASSAYANCDGSTTAPVLNVADFTCFLSKFATGCSAP